MLLPRPRILRFYLYTLLKWRGKGLLEYILSPCLLLHEIDILKFLWKSEIFAIYFYFSFIYNVIYIMRPFDDNFINIFHNSGMYEIKYF